jgi:hypothetical protein
MVMRQTLTGFAAVGLLWAAAGAGRAEDQKAVTAVIDRAIKAGGGEAKLKKIQAATWKAKGAVKEGGKQATITIEASVQGFDQFRMDLTMEENGNTHNALFVMNKDKAWAKESNRVKPAPKEVMTIIKAETYALRLAQLLYPLKDKACKLSSLGELKIGDNQTVGIKAKRKGFPEVDIYFDKKSGLPAKVQLNVKERGEAEKIHEWVLSAPKKMGGVTQFTKLKFTRDGKHLLDAEVSDLEAKDKFEASTFAKPE